jgi:hypothetical protein
MNIARHIGTALRAIAPAFGGFMEDCTLIAGAALVAYGAWEIYRPAGPITAGVLLITGIILKARGAV